MGFLFVLLAVALEPGALDVPFAVAPSSPAEIASCKGSPLPRCRFLLTDQGWKAYRDIRSLGPTGEARRVTAALTQKREVRDELAKQFLEIAANSDGEWSVAASCRAAEVLLEYARFFSELEPPPATQPEGPMEPFTLHLWQANTAVVEQALGQIDKATSRARAEGIDSAYVRRCSLEATLMRKYIDHPFGASFPFK